MTASSPADRPASIAERISAVRDRIEAMFTGEHINATEDRAVLHTALRAPAGAELTVDGQDVPADVHEVLGQMREFASQLRSGEWVGHTGKTITKVVNIGIGGSDLGPRLVVDALKDFGTGRFRVHFLTNVDGSDAQHLLKGLDPARTAAILVSKTFSTQETLLNGAVVRDWLGGSERLYAVSANVPRAEAFGADILRLCVEVGGCLTGEHGVGREKINQMCSQFNADELTLFHAVKAAFDPSGLLNPGKNIPTLHRCAEFGRMHIHNGQLPFPELERF